MAYHSNGFSGDERDPDRGGEESDKCTYLMEHLATFSVNKEITYPADGMRKLSQLEKSNGIWSQKMQLCLDRTWVLIMDYETGAVIEKFAGKSIKEPTAYTSNDPMEMYNNILVFIVNSNSSNRPAEMHIFQCQSISAKDLVADLKEMQSGRPLSRRNKSAIPPSPHKAPPRAEYRESDSEFGTANNNDDNSSTTSEQYERDVTVLNHCFDDIEKFIARLQHAVAATKELERRRKNRRSKKNDTGDGMLTMRTKPPLQKEFIDIFQKFKLSFNLLAKLKAHIHDPNAPELVHFLFTPLALIVEASHDTYYDQHIPHKVVAPLLTREAIVLLNNCVTSKETELWHSLGNAWLIPRDEWKGHVSAYHPVFLDKWSPDYPVVDALEPEVGKFYRDASDYDYDPPDQDKMFMYDHHEPKEPEGEHNMSASRSDISADSIEKGDDRGNFKRTQDVWLESLNKRNAQVVQVTYPRTANNDKELTVVRGEYLEILDDSRKWWKARNQKGEVAHVPHTIVNKLNNYHNSDIYNNPIYNTQQYKNRPESSGDSPGGADYPGSVPPAPADLVRQERLDNIPSPPPPPPPSVPIVPVPVLKRSNSTASNVSNMNDDVQSELNLVLSSMKDKKRDDLAIKPTPNVFINQKSNPDEVQMWLKAKEFSPEFCKVFKGMDGYELLKTPRDDLVSCSKTEGPRLYSQINIQKSHSGFETMRSNELKSLLEKARKKAENADD